MHALIDAKAVAERLGVSVRTVRKLTADDEIPHVRIGHAVRFDPQAIDAWLERRHRGTQAA